MKKLILTLCILAESVFSYSATGDTVVVNAHQNVIINWYGDYDQWAVFPPAGSYSKILMKYNFSDPQPNTQWDYTTNVFARKRTGIMDSTLIQYPSFTYSGNAIDTVYFNTSVTYTYFFNTDSLATDSAPSAQVTIHLYQDSLNPAIVTDSLLVYPANYFNYIYDSSGTVTDSTWVAYDSLWILQYYNIYSPFEIIEPFELGRVMTPYGLTLSANWSFDYWFDVTDYAPLLHDSVEMRIHYDGYSNGYAFSVTFYMIEGTPPRHCTRVRNVYPYKYYEYGIAGNPIENYLTPVVFDIDSAESQAMMRVIPSGHSFGGAQNCAEFCNKSFHLLVDGVQQFVKPIWRSDCGLNPIWHQGGTWIYDRSNWCPGSKTLNKDQELTPFINPGDSIALEMNMDPYIYTGGAGFNPGYILSAQLFTYGNPNFATDATVDEILKPNTDPNYSRFNPICNNPVVVIKNTGSDPLTSLTITYGISGGVMQSYNWSGLLNFLETETVYLDSMTWGSPAGNDSIFQVIVSNPNGVADQNTWNDTLRSMVGFTPMYPQQFRLQWKTNNATFETSYQLLDENGAVLYTNGPLSPNTIYNDTFNLVTGCYELRINDLGKDGLSFPFNGDGVGYARLVLTNGTNTIIKAFQADFGTSIIHHFTVGYTTGVEELQTGVDFNIYPNPSSETVTVVPNGLNRQDVSIEVYTIHGQKLAGRELTGDEKEFRLDISSFNPGIYIIGMRTGENFVVKKLIRQ